MELRLNYDIWTGIIAVHMGEKWFLVSFLIAVNGQIPDSFSPSIEIGQEEGSISIWLKAFSVANY